MIRWISGQRARQGGGPRAMFWVLVISMTLAVIIGLAMVTGFNIAEDSNIAQDAPSIGSEPNQTK